MTMELIHEHVSAHSGLDGPAARRVCDAVVEVLGGCMPDPRRVARWLPEPLDEVLIRGEGAGIDDRDGFYREVGRSLDLLPAPAMEQAQAVCTALAEILDAEARQMIAGHVPGDVAELFAPIRRPPSPERPVHDETGRTLASGQPGSRHPLSNSPPRGHRDSVARDVPHGESKLSTGHPSTEEDDHTLAGGRSGSERPISGR